MKEELRAVPNPYDVSDAGQPGDELGLIRPGWSVAPLDTLDTAAATRAFAEGEGNFKPEIRSTPPDVPPSLLDQAKLSSDASRADLAAPPDQPLDVVWRPTDTSPQGAIDAVPIDGTAHTGLEDLLPAIEQARADAAAATRDNGLGELQVVDWRPTHPAPNNSIPKGI